MSTEQGTKKRGKRNWTPFLLIFPSVIYLALFFAWPMVSGLRLAVYDDEALLSLREEPQQDSPVTDTLPQGTYVSILDQQGNLIPQEELEQETLITEIWFQISAEDADGQIVDGWAPESRIRVREETEDGTPILGTVRTKLGTGADPQTNIYAEPNENSEIVGKLDCRTRVDIKDLVILEIWYLISGEENGEIVEGWAQSRYIQVFGDGTEGRIARGDTGQLTTKYI
ncbi:MAG: SH3 domain-containing protein, partial [Chloroflexota bacterium]|nr:SH3 domain-containing protein [Chloroflexota bacterium]